MHHRLWWLLWWSLFRKYFFSVYLILVLLRGLVRNGSTDFWRFNISFRTYFGLENLVKKTVIVALMIASLTACSGVPMAQERQTSTMETVGMVAAGGALIFLLIAVNASKAFHG